MRILVFALMAVLAAVALAQDYQGWTSATRDACDREKQALCRKSEDNYNGKVSVRISKFNIAKAVETKLAQARTVVKSVKTELQLAQLQLVKAQAEESTALKYTTWVCKNNMRSKRYNEYLAATKGSSNNAPVLSKIFCKTVDLNSNGECKCPTTWKQKGKSGTTACRCCTK